MSRAYNMYVTIRGNKSGRAEQISAAADSLWKFDWFDGTPGQLEGDGDGSLGGGETDKEFAQRLAVAIWTANGAFCEIEVRSTFLESLPYESFDFGKDEYKTLFPKERRRAKQS